MSRTMVHLFSWDNLIFRVDVLTKTRRVPRGSGVQGSGVQGLRGSGFRGSGVQGLVAEGQWGGGPKKGKMSY